MRLLGAILAGGASTRFGSDKAAALLGGRALIDHAADALRPQVETLIVCGRTWPGLAGVPDRPAPGLGPLGGLCAALAHAHDAGLDAVLSVGCDVLPIPTDLPRLLGAGPAHVEGQPLFGLWPAALAVEIDRHLAEGGNRSLRGWIERIGARSVKLGVSLHNLNTPADLERAAALVASGAVLLDPGR